MIHQLPENNIAHLPFFGAVQVPLTFFSDGLVPLQLTAAVFSSGAVLTFEYASIVLQKKILPFSYLLVLIVSPFYLLHLVTVWPKFLFGGCLFVSHIEGIVYCRTAEWRRLVWAWLWFGMALASHEAAIIFLPTMLFCTGALLPWGTWRSLRANFVVATVCLILTAGVYEVWATVFFGLSTRVARNPVISYRGSSDFHGFLVSYASHFIGHFVGVPWGWFSMFKNKLNVGNQVLRILGSLYWWLSLWITLLASTIVGTLLPFLLSVPGTLQKLLIADSGRRAFKPLLLLSFLLLAVHTLLAPMPITLVVGETQQGLVGLFIGLFYYLGLRLVEGGFASRISRVLKITFLFGTLPFVCFQLPVLLGLQLPTSYSALFRNLLLKSDADAQIFYDNHLTSLGSIAFPTGIIAILMLIGVLILSWRNCHKLKFDFGREWYG